MSPASDWNKQAAIVAATILLTDVVGLLESTADPGDADGKLAFSTGFDQPVRRVPDLSLFWSVVTLFEKEWGEHMGQAAEVVREACHVIWSEGETARVADFYSEDFVADYPNTDWGEGLDGVANLSQQVRIDLPGYREHIEELIEAGDEVVVRLTITGTNPRTGEEVRFRDVSMLTVRDGRITRQRGLTDHLSLFIQLGIVDLPSLSK